MYVVYLITNIKNGKQYVGQTKLLPGDRWKQHLRSKSSTYLSRAIRKYGPYSFTFNILKRTKTKFLANYFESRFISQLKTRNSEIGYNLTDGGEGNSGWRPSEETRKNMSKSALGNTNHLGFVNTLESIQRMQYVHTGVVISEETKNKMSLAHTGKVFSNEHKKNISLARVGKPFSKTHRLSLSKNHWTKGPRAEEIRSILSIASRRIPQ